MQKLASRFAMGIGLVLGLAFVLWPNVRSATATSAVRLGFNTNTLPANDDGSTGLVPLGFTLNLFGSNYSSLYVNNNGNVTFDQSLGPFAPFSLSTRSRVIVAPFFADVDTRAGNVVTYGTGTVNGRPAFGVNWPGVGCYSLNTSVLNTFQVVIVSRSDIGPGDVDIEFNYGSVQWEAGAASGGNSSCQGGKSARIGYSNASGSTFFELPGSGVPGSFLDSNATTGLIYNSLNNTVPGRYMFQMRGGPAVGGIAELPDEPAVAPFETSDSSGPGAGVIAAIAAGAIAVGVVALGCAGWYVRRRGGR